MCGRYTLRTSGTKLAEAFDLEDSPLFETRFNVAHNADNAGGAQPGGGGGARAVLNALGPGAELGRG